MRSPIGDGALRGLDAPVLIVAERRGLLTGYSDSPIGDIAEFGGGLGGVFTLAEVSIWGLAKAGPPNEVSARGCWHAQYGPQR